LVDRQSFESGLIDFTFACGSSEENRFEYRPSLSDFNEVKLGLYKLAANELIEDKDNSDLHE